MSDFERTRRQSVEPVNELLGTSVTWYPPPWNQYSTADFYATSQTMHAVVNDTVHRHYPKEGGAFDSCKAYTQYNDHIGTDGNIIPSRRTTRYTGLFRVGEYSTGFTNNPQYSSENYHKCKTYGAEAWNRFKPAKPVVSGSVFVAELRDLPGLLFKRLNSFRNLGNNYLAYQFGWKPFLADLQRFSKSIVKIDKQIAQLRRDNGRVVRRGGVLFDNNTEQTSDRYSVSAGGTLPPTYGGTCVKTTRKQSKCWFKGAFRYYIPNLDSQKWGRARAIQELWDLKITPEQVYQLIPFSWLVDWVSNTGDVISNLMSSVEDNLVAKYAYVMLKTVHEEMYTVSSNTRTYELVNGKYKWIYHPFTCSASDVWEYKSRAVANPFGFSSTFDGFSSYQTSILAALGMSRCKF